MNRTPPLHRCLLAVLVTSLAACTILNRIDACQPSLPPDTQVNRRAEDDQMPTPGRSVAALPNGLSAVVWANGVQADPLIGGVIRATLLRPNGERVSVCASAIEEAQVSTASDEVVREAVVAAGTAVDSLVFVAWVASPVGVDQISAPATIRGRILDQQLCAISPVLTLSDPAVTISRRLAIAARSDGREAIALFSAANSFTTTVPRYLHARTFGVATFIGGRVEPNACDGGDRPCTLNASSGIPYSSVTATRDGYRVLFARERSAMVPSWDLFSIGLDSIARPGATQDLGVSIPPVTVPSISIGLLDVGFGIIWGGESRSAIGSRDVDIWFQRFTDQMMPRAPAVRLNSRTDGVQTGPTFVHIGAGRVLAGWTDNSVEQRGRTVVARVIESDDSFGFNHVSCGREEFPLSALQTGDRYATAFSHPAADSVLAIFADGSMTGTDTFGLAVRGRSLPLGRLLFQRP